MSVTSDSDAGFRGWFEQTFGAPFPLDLWTPLRSPGEAHWVSADLPEGAEARPLREEFLDQPDRYLSTGFWGHGVNSYAFYFIEKRGAHRCFLRLRYGGAYGDPAEDAVRVLAFLRAYGRFRDAREGALAASSIVHEMGQSTAELRTASGPPLRVEHIGPPAELWRQLDEALDGAAG